MAEKDAALGDPRLPSGTGYCLCRECGEYFGSVRGFETHRVGGACLSTAQLERRGMRRDARGYWRLPGTRPVLAN